MLRNYDAWLTGPIDDNAETMECHECGAECTTVYLMNYEPFDTLCETCLLLKGVDDAESLVSPAMRLGRYLVYDYDGNLEDVINHEDVVVTLVETGYATQLDVKRFYDDLAEDELLKGHGL